MGVGDGSRFEALLADLRREHQRELEHVRELQEQPQHSRQSEEPPPAHSPDDVGGLSVPTERIRISGDPVPDGGVKIGKNFLLADASDFPPGALEEEGDRDRLGSEMCSEMTTGRLLCHNNTEKLHPRSEWLNARYSANTKVTLTQISFWQSNRSTDSTTKAITDDSTSNRRRLWSISPTATYRVYWDIVGLFLVMFDIFFITLSVFDLPNNWFTRALEAITLLFWTADMLQSFFVAYYVHGDLVKDQPRVAIHYMKTWFLLDLIVVGPDWFVIVIGTSTALSEHGVSRLLRIARMVRVLRLLRVTKLKRLFNTLYDLINDEFTFILAELAKMILLILTINHVGACGWFLCGRLGRELDQNNWIEWTDKDGYSTASTGYQYATSLHWCLTQFTPASMDVVARNIVERIYSIFVLLFAMVAFSSVVGTVTTSMTIIRSMKNDSQKAFWMLRRYLNQKKISKGLTMRMVKFVEYTNSKEEKKIQRKNVKYLACLSDQLSGELSFELYAEPLSLHQFFSHMVDNAPSLAYQICGHAVASKIFAAGDLLFTIAEEAVRSYVLTDGELDYVLMSGNPIRPSIGENEWVAEAAIWTSWRYRGRCTAESPSEVLIIDVHRLAQLVTTHPKPWEYAMQYAQGFINYINSISSSNWSDVLRDSRLQEYLGDQGQAEAKNRKAYVFRK